MRYLILSDIHGSLTALNAVLPYFEQFKCDYILLLGDILYHGPRNPLPEGYAPKEVARRLNEYADKIIAVRGNCDCEVDQMLLRFPCQADYVPVFDNGIMLFLSHGHVYAPHNMPSLYGASLFLYGHTHLWELNCNNEGMWFCNPGSISLPKENRPASFAVYDNGTIAIYTLSGELLAQSDVKVATYPRLLQQAIALATEAHAGQVDRAGMPYITHPLRVMEACNTTEEKIAAVLHDVVEDTSVTLDDLATQFPPEIVEAIRCLTHLPEDTYEEYIEHVATNPIAVQVKLRDLTDNMDVRRLEAIGEADTERLRKYLKAYKRLSRLQDMRSTQ